ncbi:hypothetical protein CAMRE0001_0224 [Campylobacter rectus RM3267]|uniref:Uncharacterized protein n=1 Tax=Campylobacter rectus RM3267 TaxID=553218 RepID=B9CY29_CAMRE|nr:hypothetical protein CAMRE0001_0224 [Campylobacter rectus RM3267]
MLSRLFHGVAVNRFASLAAYSSTISLAANLQTSNRRIYK